MPIRQGGFMSDLEQVLDRLAELLRRLDPRPPADDRRQSSAPPAEQTSVARPERRGS
jgi:hypothetical protein